MVAREGWKGPAWVLVSQATERITRTSRLSGPMPENIAGSCRGSGGNLAGISIGPSALASHPLAGHRVAAGRRPFPQGRRRVASPVARHEPRHFLFRYSLKAESRSSNDPGEFANSIRIPCYGKACIDEGADSPPRPRSITIPSSSTDPAGLMSDPRSDPRYWRFPPCRCP